MNICKEETMINNYNTQKGIEKKTQKKQLTSPLTFTDIRNKQTNKQTKSKIEL